MVGLTTGFEPFSPVYGFGVQIEFVSREVASQIIKSLDTQLHTNGSSHPDAAQGESLAS